MDGSVHLHTYELGRQCSARVTWNVATGIGAVAMNVYIYQAALYCEECGEAIKTNLGAAGLAPEDADDETYDSGEYPKGPMDEGESDTPSHCGGCGTFLESRLTSDGCAYVNEAVREAIKAGRMGAVPVTAWASFYDVDIEETDSEDADGE